MKQIKRGTESVGVDLLQEETHEEEEREKRKKKNSCTNFDKDDDGGFRTENELRRPYNRTVPKESESGYQGSEIFTFL